MTANEHPLPATWDKVEILRVRARALAAEIESEDGDGPPPLRIVEFAVGRERLAIETACVREVCPLHDLTPVPHSPPFVCGIVNVRGHILTVLDLRHLLGLPEHGLVDRQHVIVVHSERGDVGLLADGAPIVRTLRQSEILPAPATLTGVRAQYLHGVTTRLAILDVARLLADPKLVVDEEFDA
jgi:purine-binding chemotaxis protein CheW